MTEKNEFPLYDFGGKRIYTAHDLSGSNSERDHIFLSYNTIRSLAHRHNRGFKKNGITYYTEEDKIFFRTKKHKAGRPKKGK